MSYSLSVSHDGTALTGDDLAAWTGQSVGGVLQGGHASAVLPVHEATVSATSSGDGDSLTLTRSLTVTVAALVQATPELNMGWVEPDDLNYTGAQAVNGEVNKIRDYLKGNDQPNGFEIDSHSANLNKADVIFGFQNTLDSVFIDRDNVSRIEFQYDNRLTLTATATGTPSCSLKPAVPM